MEPNQQRLSKKPAGVGALIGLAFGAFVAVPWGTFAGPEGPGLWLAAPLVLAFTLLGAWFATVVSFDALEQRGAERHVPAEDEHDLFGGHHGHPTPA